MGVKGLFSYISQHVEESLEWFMLMDCILIIDGSNLAYDIFYNTNDVNKAYGGDYDKYAEEIERFFKKLKECNIRPVVIMDGGQPLKKKKFSTAMQRANDLITSNLLIDPSNQDRTKTFPLFGRSVFVTVAQEMGIEVLQSDFEADHEIAVLSKKFNAFVLSNDSDFFLFDVNFILLNSLNYHSVTKLDSGKSDKKYIPCYKFNRDIFTKVTGVHKNIFPVFALLLGNDYHTADKMELFFKKIDFSKIRGKISIRHRVIKAVICWLSHQKPDLHKVLKQVVNYCENSDEEFIMEQVSEYLPKKSLLIPWLSKHETDCFLQKNNENVTTKANISKIDFKTSEPPSKLILELTCSCQNRLAADLIPEKRLPDWFIRAYRLHMFANIVGDVLNKNYIISIPQIEVSKYDSAFSQMERMIKVIRAIMWKTVINYSDDKNDPGFLRSIPSNNSNNARLNAVGIDQILTKTCSNTESVERKEKNIIDAREEHLGTDRNLTILSYSGETLSCKNETVIPTLGEEADLELTALQDENLIDTYVNNSSGTKVEDGSLTSLIHNVDECDIISSLSLENLSITENEIKRDLRNKDDGNVVENETVHQEEDSNTSNLDTDEDDLLSDDSGKALLDPSISSDIDDIKPFDIMKLNNMSEIPKLIWYLRKGIRLKEKVLENEKIHFYSDFPDLCDVQSLSLNERKNLFYKVAGYNCKFDETLPPNIEFVLICIYYWYSHHKHHCKITHLYAVLMSLIMFCIIDGKYGRNRKKGYFLKMDDYSTTVRGLCSKFRKDKLSKMTVTEIINSLTKEECLLASLTLYQFHRQDEEINRHTYSRTTVHCFSEYQASIFCLEVLNSILGFPFPLLSIKSYWSGTFCYNMVRCFSASVDSFIILQLLLKDNRRLQHLFIRLYKALQKPLNLPHFDECRLITCKNITNSALGKLKKKIGIKPPSQLGVKMNARSKNSKPVKVAEENRSSSECDIDEITEDDLAMLSGNKYSALLKTTDVE